MRGPHEKILVTGAGGFLGNRLAGAAVNKGWRVRAMVRTPPLHDGEHPASDIELVIGDLTQTASLIKACQGVTHIIHCAAATSERPLTLRECRAVNVEGTAALLRAAEAAGVRRWIQISSMSAHPASTSGYGISKFEADEAVRSSQLEWTILKPSLIYGEGPRGLVSRTLATLRTLPVLPVIGGNCLIRPILVEDVASITLQALECENSIGCEIMLGGPDEVTLRDFLVRLVRTRGLFRPVVNIPATFALALASILGRLASNPPLTRDNVLGIREARRVDTSLMSEMGWSAIGLEAGLARCTSTPSGPTRSSNS